MAGMPRDYRIEARHDGQETFRQSYATADTAVGEAKRWYAHGAVVARVIRKSDGKVLYDGPNNIDVDYSEWPAPEPVVPFVSIARVARVSRATGVPEDVVRRVLETDARNS